MEQPTTPTALKGRKERLMASTTFTQSVAPKSASEAGALDGFEMRCTCGCVQSTSLSAREARNMAWAHAQWHTSRKAGK